MRRDLKMALSGAGSDELFAGYPVFKQVFELENKKVVVFISTTVKKSFW